MLGVSTSVNDVYMYIWQKILKSLSIILKATSLKVGELVFGSKQNNTDLIEILIILYPALFNEKHSPTTVTLKVHITEFPEGSMAV